MESEVKNEVARPLEHDRGAATRAGIAKTGAQTWAEVAKAYWVYDTPFRPCKDDISLMEAAVKNWAPHQSIESQALVLGATPSIAEMQWPAKWFITGVEKSADVIKAIWPGDVATRRRAICCDWFEIPESLDRCSVIVGDGSFVACAYPDGLRQLSRLLHTLLDDKGIIIIRCYCQLEEPESVEQVFASLLEGKISNIDSFKLRLMMAVQKSVVEGARLGDVYDALENGDISQKMMEQRFGWTRTAMELFNVWREADTRYTFPTLKELGTVLSPLFEEVSVTYPPYQLGSRCPVITMRKR